jgi:phage protein D
MYHSSEEEKKLKQQKYEEHRPERKFSHKWLVGCPWLMYDKSAMFCNWCIDYNNTYVNNEFKKNMNTFITGCKNFRFSTIADHESSRIHM